MSETPKEEQQQQETEAVEARHWIAEALDENARPNSSGTREEKRQYRRWAKQNKRAKELVGRGREFAAQALDVPWMALNGMLAPLDPTVAAMHRARMTKLQSFSLSIDEQAMGTECLLDFMEANYPQVLAAIPNYGGVLIFAASVAVPRILIYRELNNIKERGDDIMDIVEARLADLRRLDEGKAQAKAKKPEKGKEK